MIFLARISQFVLYFEFQNFEFSLNIIILPCGLDIITEHIFYTPHIRNDFLNFQSKKNIFIIRSYKFESCLEWLPEMPI